MQEGIVKVLKKESNLKTEWMESRCQEMTDGSCLEELKITRLQNDLQRFGVTLMGNMKKMDTRLKSKWKKAMDLQKYERVTCAKINMRLSYL